MDFLAPEAIAQLAILGFVFFMLLNSAAVMVYVERKVAARIQQRMGPTLVGPPGLLQPLADIIKLVMKEELRPKSADPILFALAPIISAACAFTAFAVVPFGAETTFFGLLDGRCRCRWPTSTSRSSGSSPSRRWASTASCSPAGARTASTRCSARCARRRR